MGPGFRRECGIGGKTGFWPALCLIVNSKMTDKITPTSRIVLGLVMVIAMLLTFQLYASCERAVILTQRFVPDAAHQAPLEIKGKIFYVNAADSDAYYFYEHLFFSEIGAFFVICICILMWERYRNRVAQMKDLR